MLLLPAKCRSIISITTIAGEVHEWAQPLLALIFIHTHTHTYLRIECANTSNNHNRMIQRIQFIVRLVIRLKYIRMYICRHVHKHTHIHIQYFKKHSHVWFACITLYVCMYVGVHTCISRCGRLCWECESLENWEYLKNVIHLDRQGMYICLIPLDHP